MQTTIDKAGRVVIPAEIRKRAGWRPGTTLDATFEEGAIRLSSAAPAPGLVQQGRRLIARPRATGGPAVDLAALVEEERNRWPTP